MRVRSACWCNHLHRGTCHCSPLLRRRRDGRGLAELLRELSALEGLRWIRLLYCYPSYFSDELVDEIARNPKVVKYVDMPLQARLVAATCYSCKWLHSSRVGMSPQSVMVTMPCHGHHGKKQGLVKAFLLT